MDGKLKYSFGFLCAFLLAGCSTFPAQKDADVRNGPITVFVGGSDPDATVSEADGIAQPNPWQGRYFGSMPIQGELVDGSVVDDVLDLRLEISQNKVSVFSGFEGSVDEIKPGLFFLIANGDSGVIFALDRGEDRDGVWEESWVFTITKHSPDQLLVQWTRMVNNLEQPLSNVDSKFIFTGSGLFRREAELN